MSHNKVRTVVPADFYGEDLITLPSSLFSKTRKGVVFRPTTFAPTIYGYILPYDNATTAPTAEEVLDHAKYIVKYGQEGVDLSFGANISFAIVCQPGEIVEMLVEEYM